MTSTPADYQFDLSAVAADSPRLRLARAWLGLGVAALIGSGLLALMLALARTPGIQKFVPAGDFFRAALVVHVDLSVLIWFMAFACALWALAGSARWTTLGWAGFWAASAGTALLTISPFFPEAKPLLNNYIPVLQQPVFFAGLLICGAGFGAAIVRALITIPQKLGAGGTAPGEAALAFGAWLAALAGAAAAVSFLVSWVNVPAAAEGQVRWEIVFWGGGHALQFQHALLVIVAWFWLASALGAAPIPSARATMAMFALAALPLLAVPLIYAYWPVGSAFHMTNFAKLMEYGHPFMVPLGIFALASLLQTRGATTPARAALIASMALFAVGGVLAYMIRGVNVVIPAHYHGSIVGVTLAFMGLTYLLLPRIGYAPVAGKMATWQPFVYGGGQLLHVLGLAWSGGYGVQRKVAGAEQVLTSLPQKIGMGMMGLGGLIAVIGGVMFVVVCLRAMGRWPGARTTAR